MVSKESGPCTFSACQRIGVAAPRGGCRGRQIIESSSSVLVTATNSVVPSAQEGTGSEGANRQTTKAPLRTDNSNDAGIEEFSHGAWCRYWSREPDSVRRD